MSTVLSKDKRVTLNTENYVYDTHHQLFLLIRYNPGFSGFMRNKRDMIPPDINSQKFGRYEVISSSLSREYLESLRGKITDNPEHCFIMCIPGPEKVYSIRGIEKQVDTRNTYLFVSLNQITGDMIVHWDEFFYEDVTRKIKDLDSLSWVHYKLPLDINMGLQYGLPEGKIPFEPYMDYSEKPEEYEYLETN